MLNLSVKAAKASFFDRAAVVGAMDKATRKVLSKFGAFVRQQAKTSIRYRRAASAPGRPPSAHRTMWRRKTNRRTGATKTQQVSPLREFVFFAYDAARKSVVIGPALLNARGGAAALSALEYGGPSFVWEGGRRRRIYVRARPFMRPAFLAEQDALPGLWKNSAR